MRAKTLVMFVASNYSTLVDFYGCFTFDFLCMSSGCSEDKEKCWKFRNFIKICYVLVLFGTISRLHMEKKDPSYFCAKLKMRTEVRLQWFQVLVSGSTWSSLTNDFRNPVMSFAILVLWWVMLFKESIY